MAWARLAAPDWFMLFSTHLTWLYRLSCSYWKEQNRCIDSFIVNVIVIGILIDIVIVSSSGIEVNESMTRVV